MLLNLEDNFEKHFKNYMRVLKQHGHLKVAYHGSTQVPGYIEEI